MQIVFVPRDNAPERLISEAEIVFDSDGPLAGLKLVGFSLWRSADGEIYVTFPARSFANGQERKYFDYLRSMDGTPEAVRRLKETIRGISATDVDGVRREDRYAQERQ